MESEYRQTLVLLQPLDFHVQSEVNLLDLTADQILHFEQTVRQKLYHQAWMALAELLGTGVPFIVQFQELSRTEDFPKLTFTLHMHMAEVSEDPDATEIPSPSVSTDLPGTLYNPSFDRPY